MVETSPTQGASVTRKRVTTAQPSFLFSIKNGYLEQVDNPLSIVRLAFIEYLKDLLFIDIETASAKPNYDALDERMKPLWDRKAEKWDKQQPPDKLYSKAALLPEFGKIITIGAGFFYENEAGELSFRVKAFTNKEEADLLSEFKQLIEAKFKAEELRLVAHNGKGFDFPYLSRRMMVNTIRLPKALQLYGRPPWQIPHIDTMEMWRMGDPRTFVSLDLLTALFNLPSSKDQLDGSKVNQVYHEEGNLKKIAHYCIGDVIATARVYLKMMFIPDVEEENIEVIQGNKSD